MNPLYVQFKITARLVVFLFLPLVTSFALDAQIETPSWVNRIEKSTKVDWVNVVEMAPIDSTLAHLMTANHNWGFVPVYLTYKVYNDLEFMQFSGWLKGSFSPSNSRVVTVFVDNGKPMLVIETYTDNSRMGSCGNIEIENRCFLKGNRQIYVVTTESPFECYFNPVDTTRLVAIAEQGSQFGENWAFRSYLNVVDDYAASLADEIEQMDDSTAFLNELRLSHRAIPPRAIHDPGDYELVWVKPVLREAKCMLGKKEKSILANINLGDTFIGDRYCEIRLDGGEPTGIMNHTTYYYRRKE